MPLSIKTLLNLVPFDIWQPLKKFVTDDKTVVFDIAFKMSTKYTPALLIVMLCLSCANEFVRNVDIDCAITGSGNSYGSGENSELNNFCWIHETFLVAKALESKMKGLVTYPGVSGYSKENDELIRQSYYKYVWLLLGTLIVFSYLPYFFWKVLGRNKIKPMVKGEDQMDIPVDQRVALFLETFGFNASFGRFYLLCKLFATFSPLVQWYFLCGFLGGRYKKYGVDVVANFLDETSPWLNPMDALFPKMAKCEWSRYGFGGDIELKSAKCQLPMNNLTQWSFFVFWWWMAVIFIVNILSVFKLLLLTFPFCRRYHYRRFVGAACQEDIEKPRSCKGHLRNGKKFKIFKKRKSSIVDINLSFGDWIVPSRNIQDWEFRDFIRQFAKTENPALQLKQNLPRIPANVEPSCPPLDSQDDSWKPDNAGHRVRNMQMGFVQPIPKPHCDSISHPSYPTRDIVTTECDQCSATESDGCLPTECQNAPTHQQHNIKLTKPTKIDRSNFHTKKIDENVAENSRVSSNWSRGARETKSDEEASGGWG